MARPYFTGNYGSALARVDTRPIIEAGRAQGQMYANMGAQIGGMIQQYGLNKEKRRLEEDTAIGALAGFTPEELMQIGQDNPKLGKAIERAPTESATPRDFQIINASLAPIVAGKARRMAEADQDLKNRLGEQNLGLRERLEDSQVKNAQLRNVYQGLSNDLMQLSKKKGEAIQDYEITAIIDKYADEAGLREIRAGIEGEKLLQQEQALKADPLVDQVTRQRRQQEQSIKKNQLMLDAYKASEGEFPASERAKLERKKLKNDIRFKKLYMQGFSSARGATPISIDLQKNLADAQKELDRLSSQKTKYKDDDDNPLNVSDLLEVKADRTIGLIEGYDMDELDRVTKNNVQLFLAQSAEVENAQKQIPVTMEGTVSLTEFGNKPPEIGEIIDFNGQQARVIGITNGVVIVNYEGTLHDKNRLDLQAQELEEAAKVDVPRFSPSEHVQNTYGM